MLDAVAAEAARAYAITDTGEHTQPRPLTLSDV
jgi:hypothetical protein